MGVGTEIRMSLNAPYTIVVLTNEAPPAEAYVSERAVALVAAKIKGEHGASRHTLSAHVRRDALVTR